MAFFPKTLGAAKRGNVAGSRRGLKPALLRTAVRSGAQSLTRLLRRHRGDGLAVDQLGLDPDVHVSYAQRDVRPVFVLEDVRGATFERVHARRADANAALVLRGVSELAVSDSLGLHELRRDGEVTEETL